MNPKQASETNNWRKFLVRIQQVTPTHGRVMVSLTFIAENGQPVWWPKPEVLNLEPRDANLYLPREGDLTRET